MPRKKKKDVLRFEVPLATTLEQMVELLGGWDAALEFFQRTHEEAKLRAKKAQAFDAVSEKIGRAELTSEDLLRMLEGRPPKRKK